MSFFSEQPQYNPNTKEIVGCKKGSFAYLHEFRHSQQDEKGFLLLSFYLIIISLTLCIVIQHWSFALIGLWSILTLEVDAWIYSIEIKLKEVLK